MTHTEQAQRGYKAYSASAGGVTRNGEPLRAWEDLPATNRDAYEKAAVVAQTGGEDAPERAFIAYVTHVRGVAMDGTDIPRWQDLREDIRGNWVAFARGAQRL